MEGKWTLVERETGRQRVKQIGRVCGRQDIHSVAVIVTVYIQ